VRFRSALQLIALVVVAAACVAPTRTEAAYQAKAADTAEAVVSAARTVLVTARVAAAGRSFGPTVAVTVADAEADAASARDAFASIQPPDARSDAIRRDLLPEIERAVEVIELVRIAARRDQLGRLPAIAAPLEPIAARLDRFATRYR
jgi:predicted dienelactone hydrolase